MEIRKPHIKSIPYSEFKDNDTLEQITQQLNEGGANVVLGNLDQVINWGRSNSLWSLTFGTSCCGIEFMAVGCSRYDFSRFGFEVTRNSARQVKIEKFFGGANHKMTSEEKERSLSRGGLHGISNENLSSEKLGNKAPIIVSSAPNQQAVEQLAQEIDTLQTEGENNDNNK